MARGAAVGILICMMMLWIGIPAGAAGERGTIRVDLGPEQKGKQVTLYWAEDTEAGDAEVTECVSRKLSEEGTAMFSGLPEGTYLLTLENSMSVMIVLPEKDGSWMAQIAPGMDYIPPETGQPVTPLLWAMAMVLSAFGIGIWYEGWHKSRRE